MAVAGEGVPIGVIGIRYARARVYVRVCVVWVCGMNGWMAHIEMLARRTCADSG